MGEDEDGQYFITRVGRAVFADGHNRANRPKTEEGIVMSSNSTMYRQLGTVGWIIIAASGVLQMIDGSLIAGATVIGFALVCAALLNR